MQTITPRITRSISACEKVVGTCSDRPITEMAASDMVTSRTAIAHFRIKGRSRAAISVILVGQEVWPNTSFVDYHPFGWPSFDGLTICIEYRTNSEAGRDLGDHRGTT